ncbi:MAG: glycosyltransferase, partial [Nocardioides sp.]
SVLQQTRVDFVLTICDDSHPSFPLADHIDHLGDARVRYVQNERVLGAGANFARLLSMASGDRVAFMGADDVLHPSYLHRMAQLVERHPEADVIQPGVRVIDADGSPLTGTTDRVKRLLAPAQAGRLMVGERLASSLLSGNWTYFPSLLWRRSTIDSIGFREYDVVQDLGLLLDVVMQGGTLLVDDAVTFDYRRHDRSLSTRRTHTGARFAEERDFLAAIATELHDLGWDGAARSARRRSSSRLHAASLVPRAAGEVDLPALRRLLRHALGR